MTKQVRNTMSLEWLMQNIADEMHSAGVFATFDNHDPQQKATDFVAGVVSLAQTSMVGTINATVEFPETLSKFSIGLEISGDDEVTISSISFKYLSYTPALGITPGLDLAIKRMAGLSPAPVATEMTMDNRWLMDVTGESNPDDAMRVFANNYLRKVGIGS